MSTLTIRGIPDHLKERLAAQASKAERSLEAHVRKLMEEAVGEGARMEFLRHLYRRVAAASLPGGPSLEGDRLFRDYAESSRSGEKEALFRAADTLRDFWRRPEWPSQERIMAAYEAAFTAVAQVNLISETEAVVLGIRLGGAVSTIAAPSAEVLAAADRLQLANLFTTQINRFSSDSSPWNARSALLFKAGSSVSVDSRDSGQGAVTPSRILANCALDALISAFLRAEGAEHTKPTMGALSDYLNALPGFSWDKARAGKPQHQTTIDQHGYVLTHVTAVVGGWEHPFGQRPSVEPNEGYAAVARALERVLVGRSDVITLSD